MKSIKQLYTMVRNILFLRKIIKTDTKKLNFTTMVKIGSRFYKNFKKNSYERNLFAQAIKKYRSEYPYHIIGWTSAQKLYEQYPSVLNAIKSLREVSRKFSKGKVYVTMFRDESVYKGEKPFQYCINGTMSRGLPSVHEVKSFDKKRNCFSLSGLHLSLDEEWMRAFRYSTKQEIQSHEREKSRIARIDAKIEKKQQEIQDLYEIRSNRHKTPIIKQISNESE